MGAHGRIVVALLLLAMGIADAARATGPGATSEVERGEQVYRAQRCAICHSIAGAGNRRYPLDGVGRKLSADDIRKWVVAPQEMDPAVRKKAYDLPADDLAALVAYLKSLED